MDLQQGDTLYLFTDGFADQFGGPDDRKSGYKPFQKLLLSLQKENMPARQAFLLKASEAWKGDRRQTDDVLLIGIRI